MGIRNKILLYFSLTTIVLAGAALLFIHALFAEYREEEFQQRQQEKIKSTLYFISEIRHADSELAEAIDRLSINDIFNEKLLIFNEDKRLIYSSIDDTPIHYSKKILDGLSNTNKWYEGVDGVYDVVGLYFEKNGLVYYGISKAYDKFGYTKLNYLTYILVATFIAISLIVLFLSYFLAKRITQPLLAITNSIQSYDIEGEYLPISFNTAEDEIAILGQQFNKLMKRLNEVFLFQKHAIHHISHELKTPIAILVSNFERIEKQSDPKIIEELLKDQKEDTKNLGEIVNSLLAISKAEAGNVLKQDVVRIDELLFDVAEELKNIDPEFKFMVDYKNAVNDTFLTIHANERLLKSALMNLMLNCVQYSNDKTAKIKIDHQSPNIEITFENNGEVIQNKETRFLFQHFFRGQNSQGKRGFGLGLVLIHKIALLHGGNISYQSLSNVNIFKLVLPLS